MLNQQFLEALARMESVAATQEEKTAINAVRGKYVDLYGSDNTYVNMLGRLESVAASDADREAINEVRGRFGLMKLTEGEIAQKVAIECINAAKPVVESEDDDGDLMDYSNADADSLAGVIVPDMYDKFNDASFIGEKTNATGDIILQYDFNGISSDDIRNYLSKYGDRVQLGHSQSQYAPELRKDVIIVKNTQNAVGDQVENTEPEVSIEIDEDDDLTQPLTFDDEYDYLEN